MSILLLLVHITVEVVARTVKQEGEIEIEKELRKEEVKLYLVLHDLFTCQKSYGI